MKTTNEFKINKLQTTINNNVNSKNLISNNKGIVAVKNASNTESSDKVLSTLKVAVNNICNGKSFVEIVYNKIKTRVYLRVAPDVSVREQ